MNKKFQLSLTDMKALLPPLPVLATESLKQVERIFDQVAATLKTQDIVEGLLMWDFVIAAWEGARYTRHRTVAFDRKFKDTMEIQLQHLQSQKARREALAQRLAEYLGQRPSDVGHLVKLEDQMREADVEINEILKRTPAELAYNQALERSITFQKDLEFLITSITKRRNEALEVLERYRQGLGKRVEQLTEEVLNAEYNVVETVAIENQSPQAGLAPAAPSTVPDADAPQMPHQPETGESEQLGPTGKEREPAAGIP